MPALGARRGSRWIATGASSHLQLSARKRVAARRAMDSSSSSSSGEEEDESEAERQQQQQQQQGHRQQLHHESEEDKQELVPVAGALPSRKDRRAAVKMPETA